jgi:hypothetical protein
MNDANDLLDCYSDDQAALFFNNDNCTSDFRYESLDEMKKCIQFWLEEYDREFYIRFAIVDKNDQKAVGTLEYFDKDQPHEHYGNLVVLRIDLYSTYEREYYIDELIKLVDHQIAEDFATDTILTKAIPEAIERVKTLKINNYEPLTDDRLIPYEHYYVKQLNR